MSGDGTTFIQVWVKGGHRQITGRILLHTARGLSAWLKREATLADYSLGPYAIDVIEHNEGWDKVQTVLLREIAAIHYEEYA